MQILKIYGVLKYIANISGLTAFAASSMSALVRPPPSLSFHVYLQVVPLENASAHSSHAESLFSVHTDHVWKTLSRDFGESNPGIFRDLTYQTKQ